MSLLLIALAALSAAQVALLLYFLRAVDTFTRAARANTEYLDQWCQEIAPIIASLGHTEPPRERIRRACGILVPYSTFVRWTATGDIYSEMFQFPHTRRIGIPEVALQEWMKAGRLNWREVYPYGR